MESLERHPGQGVPKDFLTEPEQLLVSTRMLKTLSKLVNLNLDKAEKIESSKWGLHGDPSKPAPASEHYIKVLGGEEKVARRLAELSEFRREEVVTGMYLFFELKDYYLSIYLNNEESHGLKSTARGAKKFENPQPPVRIGIIGKDFGMSESLILSPESIEYRGYPYDHDTEESELIKNLSPARATQIISLLDSALDEKAVKFEDLDPDYVAWYQS